MIVPPIKTRPPRSLMDLLRQQALQQFNRIHLKRRHHLDEFNQIETAFAAFIFRDERLGTIQTGRNIRLGEPPQLPSRDQQRLQLLLLWRTERSGHKVRQKDGAEPFTDPTFGLSHIGIGLELSRHRRRSRMVALDPAVADEVPWADALTAYDDAHLVLYLRVLDAEAAGADWRQVARILLQRDATAEPERALRCWNAHLKRAQWIAETKYNERLREALLQDIGIVETFDQRA